MRNIPFLLALGTSIFLVGGITFFFSRPYQDVPATLSPPVPLVLESPSPLPSTPPSPRPTPTQRSILLDVPFMSQAPTGAWVQPYEDFCEETALLMAYAWTTHTSPTRAEADKTLHAMKALEEKRFGTYHDTSAQKTMELYTLFYKKENVRLVKNATADDIRAELTNGNIVVAPMAGQLLRGPFYRPPGPLYHMLLFRGYDTKTDTFIVNDDGTNTKGEAFRFSRAAITRSWRDWNDTAHTLKAPDTATPMLVFSPE